MRKRNSNPGVEKRGETWCARYYDSEGKRRSRNFRSKAEAVAFKREQESQVKQGTWLDPKDQSILFKDFIEIWKSTKSNLSEKTWATYESQLQKYLLPDFGNQEIRSIRPSSISEWQSRCISDGAGSVSLNRTLALMSQILEFAVLDGRLHRNPVKGIKRVPIRRIIKRIEVIDANKLSSLVKECGDYSTLVLMAGLTGMRWGELTALRVLDIDLNKGVVAVTKAHSTDKAGALIETTTKTRQIREIPISSKLATELRTFTATKNPNEYLFQGPRGGVLNYEWFMRAVWKPAVKRLGIETFGFHGLRRTCASLMISQHAPITTVSSVLGHSSVRTTLEAYAHFYDDEKLAYLEKVSSKVN